MGQLSIPSPINAKPKTEAYPTPPPQIGIRFVPPFVAATCLLVFVAAVFLFLRNLLSHVAPYGLLLGASSGVAVGLVAGGVITRRELKNLKDKGMSTLSVSAMLLLLGSVFVLAALVFLLSQFSTMELSLLGFAFSVFPAIFAARAALFVLWEQKNGQHIYQRGLSPVLHTYPNTLLARVLPSYPPHNAEKDLRKAITSEIGTYPRLSFYATIVVFPALYFALIYIWFFAIRHMTGILFAITLWLIAVYTLMGYSGISQAIYKLKLNREFRMGLTSGANGVLEYFRRVQNAERNSMFSMFLCNLVLFAYVLSSYLLGYVENVTLLYIILFGFIALSIVMLGTWGWRKQQLAEKTNKFQSFIEYLETANKTAP